MGISMSNKTKTLLGVLALVVLVGASYIAYGSLSSRYKPDAGTDISQENAPSVQTNTSDLEKKLAQSTGPAQQSSPALTTQSPQSKSNGAADAAPPAQKAPKVNTAQGAIQTPAAKSPAKTANKVSPPSPADTREKAPDFTVQDFGGKSVKLSGFFGKPVVVNFWASWCGPCKSEMPHFNKAYSTYKGKVTFMMVDLVDGQRETVKSGNDYVKSLGFKFPVYFDTDQDAAYTYRIQSIPTTLFIDSGGHIVKTMRGAMEESTLISNIKSIL